MNHAQCEWISPPMVYGPNRCTNQGIYVILYGCLRLHTAEIIFCLEHTKAWEDMAATDHAYCPKGNCSNCVDAFTRIHLANATHEWLTHRT